MMSRLQEKNEVAMDAAGCGFETNQYLVLGIPESVGHK